MRKRPFTTTFVVLALLLSVAISAKANERSDTEKFFDGIGSTLYAFAWPTATYKGIRLDDISPNSNGGIDVTLVVYGLSAFDESSLWTEVVVTLRNWEITDLHWGRNNAIIAQPGSTVKIFGEMLAELNREAGSSGSGSAATTHVQTWTLTDACNDGLGVRFRVFTMTNGKADGVWPNWQEDYIVPRGGSQTVQLRVERGAKLCYGAAPNTSGSSSYWGVGLEGTEGCKECCESADPSTVSFRLTCQ